jgi:hypothetical protein
MNFENLCLLYHNKLSLCNQQEAGCHLYELVQVRQAQLYDVSKIVGRLWHDLARLEPESTNRRKI